MMFSAQYYIRVMNKVKEDPKFLENENTRLTKILNNGMSDAKLDDMTMRRNVIQFFMNANKHLKSEV